jgi:Tat protein secretion system quality control protein TatD with DNase activity
MRKTPKYATIDAHLHVVDFLQESDGLKALLERMDEAKVEKAVIFGVPVTKEWSEWEPSAPSYYLSDNARCYYYALTDTLVAERYLALSKEKQERFIPLMCGFNPVDKYAIKHVQRTLKLYPGVFQGIGELLLRHDDLTNLLYGQPPRANHPALEAVYKLAGDRDLPVLLHQDITSIGRDTPIYQDELAHALERFPQTTFVWAHCGFSRRVQLPEHAQYLEDLLSRFDNLYVDYSWLVFDTLICPDGRPDDVWLEMTERFSERICLGSDVFGRFASLVETMAKYTPFLDALSDQARRNLTRDTALRLYDKPALSEPL